MNVLLFSDFEIAITLARKIRVLFIRIDCYIQVWARNFKLIIFRNEIREKDHLVKRIQKDI